LLYDNWQSEHLGLGELDKGQFDTTVEVDYLSGCALLISREVIEAVGMLDEDFFAYNEDVEWCYRGKRIGFKSIFVPEAKVWHPDTRGRDEDSPVVTYYITRNSLQFIRKHGLGYAPMARTLSGYARTLLSWSLRPRWRHKHEQRNALAHAMLDFARKRFGPME
jgi:GT2 family glycosyltransferase